LPGADRQTKNSVGLSVPSAGKLVKGHKAFFVNASLTYSVPFIVNKQKSRICELPGGNKKEITLFVRFNV
jgi:hypothetical protein